MRDTGVIHKDLSDDGAAPYIGQARVELGILKTQLALGGIASGQRTRMLPDGTVIRVDSRMGIDRVYITVPAPAGAPAAETGQLPAESIAQEGVSLETQLELDDLHRYCYAGYTWKNGPAGGGAGDPATMPPDALTYWKTPTQPVPIVLPQGATRPILGGLSDDGSTVAGSFTAADFSFVPFSWTRAGGVVPLNIDTTIFTPQPSSISRDARIIVGVEWSYGGVWAYTKAGGFVILPNSMAWGGFINNSPVYPVISPNGRYIAAAIVGPSGVSSVAVWEQLTRGTWTGPFIIATPAMMGSIDDGGVVTFASIVASYNGNGEPGYQVSVRDMSSMHSVGTLGAIRAGAAGGSPLVGTWNGGGALGIYYGWYWKRGGGLVQLGRNSYLDAISVDGLVAAGQNPDGLPVRWALDGSPGVPLALPAGHKGGRIVAVATPVLRAPPPTTVSISTPEGQ